MIVVEGQQPLGEDAHHYYDDIIRKLRKDTDAHPAHPGLLGRQVDRGGRAERRRQGRLREANIAGNQGTTLANDSVEAVRKVIEKKKRRPGCRPTSRARPR